MQRFCLIRHSLVLLTSHTPVLTPPLLYIFLPVVYTQESQGMLKVHLIFRTCRKNYFTLFRKKTNTFRIRRAFKTASLCGLFLGFNTISNSKLTDLYSQTNTVYKALLYKSGADCQVLTQQTEDSSPRALDLRSSPRKET